MLDPATKSARRGYVTWIDKIEVPDPETVRFITKGPYAIVLDQLNTINIVPAKYFKSNDAAVVAQKPMGWGPKVTSWAQQDRAVLEVYPDFWDGAPADRLKTIDWRVIPEASTAIAELISGGTDMVIRNVITPDQIPSLKQNERIAIASDAILRTGFILMDSLGGPARTRPRSSRSARRSITRSTCRS